MLCLTEPHNWDYHNGYRKCKYCGFSEAHLKGPIEVAEIKPYNYGRSGKPTKWTAFGLGLLLLLLIGGIIVFGFLVALVLTFGG